MKCKIAIIVLLLSVASTNARTHDNVGVGVILGEPTGFSLKYWLDEERAVDGAAAWSYSENDSFQLHGDYLIHDYGFFNDDQIPVYYGIGARLKLKDDDGRGRNEHDPIFGIRVPLGVTYLFEEAPLDAFFELVPVLDLSPDVDLDINVAVGLRYYF
ncbi:MAG TPA: hypothetical protein DIU00_06055 [Phycisphaerales bacterium]|nr:hypothetical protein [Phycisphaerales bacterium]